MNLQLQRELVTAKRHDILIFNRGRALGASPDYCQYIAAVDAIGQLIKSSNQKAPSASDISWNDVRY